MSVDVPKIITDDPTARETLVSATDGEPLCGTVMRADLLRALANALPSDGFMLGREVTGCVTSPVNASSDSSTGRSVAALTYRDYPDGKETTEMFDLSHRRRWDPRQGPGGHVRPVRSKVRRHSDHIRVHEGGRRFGKRREVSLFTLIFAWTSRLTSRVLFNTYRPQSEHGEAHQWFGDGCYTLVYTAGGKGVEHKQHNIAVCIADDTETDENPEWRVNGGKSPK
jgi:hypothetical protein